MCCESTTLIQCLISCIILREREILARQNTEYICEPTEQEQMTLFEIRGKKPTEKGIKRLGKSCWLEFLVLKLALFEQFHNYLK